MRAHVRTRMRITATPTHMDTHMCPVVARLVRARSRPARPTRRPIGGAVFRRGGGGTHRILRLGQSAAAGSAASSVLPASLRANRAAAPGGSGPPLARRSDARASHARAGLGRRPTTGNAAAAASNAARRGPAPGAAAPRAAAQRRHRRERARRRRGGRGTHRVSKSLHWPSDSGSALTFVEEMILPEHRARVRHAPAAHQWADVGANGAEAMERRPRMP